MWNQDFMNSEVKNPEEIQEEAVGIIEPVEIDQEMRTAYIDYSMSVIVSRALPDARDGLKPVQRRVLFGMDGLNLGYGGQTKKSARIVGEVLGKFHPHGDSSVYDAMARLAQNWNQRYPLIYGQGNFGSMDGDPVAAMRYTEAKFEKITAEVLADIDKDTVDMTLNFDDTLEEPTVLPTKVPLLLLNGSSGIAVGMATNMAPHNLGECCDAICAFIDNPDIDTEGLMQHIKGPDFPTGGIIMGRQGIVDAYNTGRGRVVLRAKTEIEELAGGREILPDDGWKATVSDKSKNTLVVWGSDFDGFTNAFKAEKGHGYTAVIPAGVVKNAAGELNGQIVIRFVCDESTGIVSTDAPAGVKVTARYDLNGRKLDKAVRGINIERLSDGTVRKVVVK